MKHARAAPLLLLLATPAVAGPPPKPMTTTVTMTLGSPRMIDGHAQLVAVHPDGKRWASALPQGVVYLWDGDKQVGSFEAHPVHALSFSPDGKALLASPHRSDPAGSAIAAAPDPLRSLNASGRSFELLASALSPDGKQLLAVASFRPGRGIGADDRRPAAPEQVLLVDAKTGKVQKTLWKGSEERCEAAAAGARAIAVADVDIWVWDRKLPKARRVLRGPAAKVRQLAFSPDGALLAAADADGVVSLFRVASGEAVARFKAHDDNAPRLAFHPRRPALATGAGDGRIKLWALDGAPLAPPLEAGGMVQDLAFSADGRRLLAAVGGRPVWFEVTGD